MTQQSAEFDEEHWHSTDGVGPYRCRGCNGSSPTLTDAQVASIYAGMPTRYTKEQWQAVIDRRVYPPGEVGK